MKNKVSPEELETATKVAEDFIENSLAVPDAPKDMMSVLLDQTVISEIGLVTIKTLKGSESFDGGAQGTLESPLNAIIIESEPTRTLWGQGDDATIKKILDWSRRPICSSRNEWDSNNRLLQPGWIKGSLNKELDIEAPDQVKMYIESIQKSNFHCSKCPWAEYESAVSGRGQACRSSYRLLLYLPQEDIIAVLSVTPSSLKNWREFNIGLQRKSPAMYVTDISTVPVKTDSNIEYNKLEFRIHKENKAPLFTTREMLKPLSGYMNYNGKNMSILEAYILEFRRVELEYEDDNGIKEDEF